MGQVPDSVPLYVDRSTGPTTDRPDADMNFSAIAGLALTCTAILLGIALGGPLEFFFDPISLGLALTITPMLLFVAHRSGTSP